MQGINIDMQNRPEWYNKSGGTWAVSGGQGVAAVTFTDGTPLTLYGFLPIGAEGFILDLKLPNGARFNLCSPETLALIMAAREVNPHYAPWSNGVVSIGGRPVTIGKTLPTITITSERLIDIANRQRGELFKAGVNDAQYPYETADIVPGLPVGIVEQLAYTLNSDAKRFVGSYTETVQSAYLHMDEQWRESFEIGKLYEQRDGAFDTTKMINYLRAELDLHNRLMADFNSLKLMFRLGTVAPGTPVLEGLPLDLRTVTDSIWSGDAADPANSPIDTITVPSETANLDYTLAATATTTTAPALYISAATTTTTTTQSATGAIVTTTTTAAPQLYVTDAAGNQIPLGSVTY